MDAVTIQEIAKKNPAEAHRLVAESLGERGHRAFFEFRGRQECIRKAMAKPLPGATGDAFLCGPTCVAGETVREVMPVHIAMLQKVESPLLEMFKAATESKEKKSDAEFSEQQQWDACFIFTSEPKYLRQVLKSASADEIKKSAEEKCSEFNLAKINSVMMAVLAQFHRHVQTTVKFSAELEGQVDKRFFQALNPKA